MDPLDLDRLRSNWIRIHEPVGNVQRCGWEDDWRSELRQVPYLTITHFTTGDLLRALIEMRARVNLNQRNLEFVKMDLERMWSRIAEGTDAYHSIVTTGRGFTFAFSALMRNDNYISGAIEVQPAA